jgi:hypothetical protein
MERYNLVALISTAAHEQGRQPLATDGLAHRHQIEALSDIISLI